MRMHVEAILLPRKLPGRCCSLDSTGLLFSRMPIPCVGNATNAKAGENFSSSHDASKPNFGG